MRSHARFGILLVALVAAACAQPPAEAPDTRPADEAAIHAAIKAWSAASQAKDAAAFASFYADDGVLMLEGQPDLRGIAAIREGAVALMQDPAFSLKFEATKVEAARSGDLAYEIGTYVLTVTDEVSKKPITVPGHYVVVWKKQADGTWKVIADVPVSDPPAAPGGN